MGREISFRPRVKFLVLFFVLDWHKLSFWSRYQILFYFYYLFFFVGGGGGGGRDCC